MPDPSEPTVENSSPRTAGERQVRALPFIAISALVATVAAIVLLGKLNSRLPVAMPSMSRHAGEPTAVRDVDHYVPGSPPAVSERFLRAWMRARYDDARMLATGAMREHCDRELSSVGGFNASQMEEYRQTRVFLDATNYDLEHIAMRDLPPGPDGMARKEVQGQAHAYGSYDGARMDSRRGQTFVLELVDGAWRVADRTWETFER